MSIKYRTGQGTSASDFTNLVVKVGDTLPIGTEVDYDGQSVPAGWQEVDDPNVYSTDETRIGTWIDGKPLYRKVIVYHPNSTIGGANTVTNISIPHGISNFGQIVKRSMVDETGFAFPTVASSSGTTVTASSTITKVDSSGITFRIINDTWGARDFYITLEYTKTTD